MNNTYKVTSYELSSRLKALGVPQMSEHYCHNIHELEDFKANDYEDKKKDGNLFYTCVSAYDIAELGKMLPEYIYSHKESSGWSCWRSPDDRDTPSFQNKNEAEARGLMLEYLITNNHIKVEDITL